MKVIVQRSIGDYEFAQATFEEGELTPFKLALFSTTVDELRKESKAREPEPIKADDLPPIGEECHHEQTKDITGQGKNGAWVGKKCVNCGSACFQNRTKDGRIYWSKWSKK